MPNPNDRDQDCLRSSGRADALAELFRDMPTVDLDAQASSFRGQLEEMKGAAAELPRRLSAEEARARVLGEFAPEPEKRTAVIRGELVEVD